MIAKSVSYKRHRFPPEIIARAVWLYFRFPLSLRLVENLELCGHVNVDEQPSWVEVLDTLRQRRRIAASAPSPAHQPGLTHRSSNRASPCDC
jgi:transposase-like protein